MIRRECNMIFQSLRTTLIVISLLILIIPTSIIGVSSYTMAKNSMDEAGKLQLKQSTDKAISMINLLNQSIDNGQITLQEAHGKLRVELLGEKKADNSRTLKEEHKIGQSGYILAVDSNQNVVMAPENEGQNLKGQTSEDGIAIGEAFLKTGKEGGFVAYESVNPNSGQIEPQLTYVYTEPNWGWTIASGTFLSEFEEQAMDFAMMVALVTAVSVIAAVILTYLLAGRITKPIQLISQALNATASGNFTGKTIVLHRKDEIGRLARDFNLMKEHTKKLIHQVSTSTEHVATSSEQLAASADQSSRSTSEVSHSMQQVATASADVTNSLQETARSIEEVAIAVQNLAENANIISETGNMVSEQAQNGHRYVKKTVTQMNSIHDKVSESSHVLQLLDKSSNEIGEITKVITDIANQTNLLALNAAIEAARAGEHGKGFAVVADEVRKLAEQSQNSTKQIAALITDIQGHMNQSTHSMEAVKAEVQEGLSVVEQTETSFNEIVHSMQNMNTKVTDMAAMVEEMSASTEEITTTVSHISAVTKDTSAHTQQVAAATEEQLASIDEIATSAESLSSLAVHLQQQVSHFKV